MSFAGVEEIISRLVGPKSFLRDMLKDQEPLSDELLEIIKELLQPQKTPSMGKVDALIRDVIQKVSQDAKPKF